jgi:hypothetical protein
MAKYQPLTLAMAREQPVGKDSLQGARWALSIVAPAYSKRDTYIFVSFALWERVRTHKLVEISDQFDSLACMSQIPANILNNSQLEKRRCSSCAKFVIEKPQYDYSGSAMNTSSRDFVDRRQAYNISNLWELKLAGNEDLW